jgi:hypothetical protein
VFRTGWASTEVRSQIPRYALNDDEVGWGTGVK